MLFLDTRSLFQCFKFSPPDVGHFDRNCQLGFFFYLQLLVMLSGADGKILWQRIPEESSYDLYNVLIIRDVNNDGYLDILATRYRPNSGKYYTPFIERIPKRNREFNSQRGRKVTLPL